MGVDGINQPETGGEIGIVQDHAKMLSTIELYPYFSLNETTIGNVAYRGMILLRTTARLPTNGKASYGHWPLGHGIDLAIGSTEGGEE